jgi:CRISPR-associated protein Csx10
VNHVWLKLTLLDDAVVSERSATVGGHRSLDHLPGSVLLGAIAARSYAGLDEETAFRRFHSGRVRFGAACPIDDDGDVTVPTPLALHVEKGGDPGALVNRAVAPAERGRQWKLVAGGFRDAALRPVRVELRSSMRTAVAVDGRARDGHLFTLGAIARGATFLARVDADDEADLVDVRGLHGHVIRVGKSRSAEFGGVRVDVLATPPVAAAWRCEDGARTTVRVLALADVVLRTPEGAPTCTPAAHHFGLPADWSFDAGRSFLRTRVWSPFNGHRRRPDLERQAIVAGSVLTFEGTTPVELAALQTALARGVGDGRAEGLGLVLVNPCVLAEARIEVPAAQRRLRPADEAPVEIGGELKTWLDERETEREHRDAAWETAMAIADAFAGSNARLPRAQWGELRAFARVHVADRRSAFVQALKGHLLEDADAARRDGRSARKGERRWGQRVRVGGQTRGLGEWLVTQLDEELGRHRGAAELSPAAVLELVAIHAPRRHAARSGERRS